MREKWEEWMKGRYGTDAFSNFLARFAVVLALIALIFHRQIFSAIALAFLVYSLFRIFSRNLSQRALENRRYLLKTQGLRNGFQKYKRRLFGEKGYKYFPCENCGRELRVPKHKGKIKIRCPKCKHEMIKRT